MEVIKEKDMKLLSRKRVIFMIDNKKGTPSRVDLVKEIAKNYKANEELIVIKHIYSQFGKNKTKLIVHIYEDKEKMDLFEHEDLLKKHKGESVTKDVEEKPPKPEQQQPVKEEASAEAPKSVEKPTKEEKPESKPEEKLEEKAEEKPAQSD